MPPPRYFTAAEGAIKFEGVKVASITGITWTETVTRRAVREIGKLHTSARPAVAIDVSMQIQFVRPKSQDEKVTGLIGSRALLDVLQEEPLQIELYGKTDGKSAYSFINMVYTGGNWSMPGGDVITGSASYEGERMKLASEK